MKDLINLSKNINLLNKYIMQLFSKQVKGNKLFHKTTVSPKLFNKVIYNNQGGVIGNAEEKQRHNNLEKASHHNHHQGGHHHK